jgi:opacity protein-like surface antigen
MLNMCARRWIAAASMALAACTPSVASAQNYDGFGMLRFGAFVQGNWTNLDITDKALVVPDSSATLNGAGIGATFGIDYRYGDVIYGVEADGSISNDSDNYGVHTFATDYFATVRGRFGVYTRPDLMLYGTFGVAIAGVEYKPSFQSNFIGNGTLKLSETLVGLTVGGGVEYEPIESVILFGEYLYTSFETWEFSARGGSRFAIDPDSHLFRVGVKFKIGHDHYVDPYRGIR